MVVAIDPGDATPLINYLQKNSLDLKTILITHHHADHVGGLDVLKNRYKIDVYAPKREFIQGVTHSVDEPDMIRLSDFGEPIKVINVAGHTRGHIAYFWRKNLFCGDTLFSAGCGRIFEGTVEQMYTSLQKILELPDDTKIYCAHEYTLQNLKFALRVEPNNCLVQDKLNQVLRLSQLHLPTLPSLLSVEKEINPFLRCSAPEIIQMTSEYAGLPLVSELEVFRCLRELKNNYRVDNIAD